MGWRILIYPDNWDELADAAKRRAGYRCEHCGAKRHQRVRTATGEIRRVVLTAAHVHGERTDDPNARLLSLCLGCHSRYDSAQHLRTRNERQRERQVAAGQQWLWSELG